LIGAVAGSVVGGITNWLIQERELNARIELIRLERETGLQDERKGHVTELSESMRLAMDEVGAWLHEHDVSPTVTPDPQALEDVRSWVLTVRARVSDMETLHPTLAAAARVARDELEPVARAFRLGRWDELAGAMETAERSRAEFLRVASTELGSAILRTDGPTPVP
jgi:hypothetical protein